MTNTSQIHRILSTDPNWAAYALADLQPRFAEHCQWSVAAVDKENAKVDGLVLFFDLLTPTAIVTVGDAAAVAAALAQADLPNEIYLNVQADHLPRVAKHYDFPEGTVAFYRMYLPVAYTQTNWDTSGTIRLRAPDADRLRQLYSHGGPHTPDAFDTYQLADGFFYGVADPDGALKAAGGTHIVDHEQSVAAIGNMYTRPDARGQGLGATVLRAIVAGMKSAHIQTIILNVNQHNEVAQRLYKRHGFEIHCPYWEGVGVRK